MNRKIKLSILKKGLLPLSLSLSFASPMEAHLSYSKDDCVIAMIAEGIGNKQVAPLIKEKCEWTEITD
jgi:hypothetical protein